MHTGTLMENHGASVGFQLSHYYFLPSLHQDQPSSQTQLHRELYSSWAAVGQVHGRYLVKYNTMHGRRKEKLRTVDE